MLRSTLLAGLLVAVLAAPAHAEFKGAPGKVAYIQGFSPTALKIWDPAAEARDPGNPQAGVTTIETRTYDLPTASTQSLGSVSPPVWSPDGTRIAYVKSIPDDGNFPQPLVHTAIFVHDLRDGRSFQLTQPPDAFYDEDPEAPLLGHTAADWSPAWSPDGTEVVFIRQLIAQQDDALFAQRGQNLWTVPADGGSQAKATSYGINPPYPTNNAVWIPGTTDVLVGFVDEAHPGGRLVRQPIGGGGASTVVDDPFVSDFDVSPDGKKFGYTTIAGGALTGFSGDLAGGAAVEEGAWSTPLLRFSNTGSGLLRTGCMPDRSSACGVMEHELDDDQADLKPGETDRFMLAWQDRSSVIGGPGPPSRIGWDVQPQTLPVIFVPGFLGSTITCDGDEAWPDMPFPDLLPMRLTDDGLGNADCPSAGPDGTLVETVLGSDIYKSVADHVREKFGDRGTLFAWDWRKRPQESLDRLDQAISTALARDGPWVGQQADRVVLWGHSYGGLLIRSYIDEESDGRARVARVLTAGTPYWGAPKSVFPLTFGIESPVFSAMDIFINNDRLKLLARNLAGLYQLYPSDHHPQWLSLDGAGLGQDAVAAFIGSVGGNQSLLAQARGYHQSLYDGFYDFGGRIDVRAVVGTGLETVRSVDITHGPQGGFAVTGRFGNGDSTVPGLSAAQGPVGTSTPLGDPVHLQYTCNISHVPLPGNGVVLEAYDDFLDFGRVPRKLEPRPCSAGGGSYWFDAGVVGLQPTSKTAARAGTPIGLEQADRDGLIDLIDARPSVGVVTDDDLPVTLTTQVANATFTYTPLADDKEGTTLTYGPVTGTLELAPAPPGGAPAVTVDGATVEPHLAPPGPPPAGPGPSPMPTPTPAPTTPKKLRLVGKPKLKGRKLTLKVFVPGPGTLKAAVRRQGSRQLKPKAAGTRKLVVRLKKRVPKKLRLTVTFKPATGATQRVKRTIKRRARASSSRARPAAAAPRPPG